MEVNGQLHASSALPPGEIAPDTQCAGSWVGRRASMDNVKKEIEPRPFSQWSVAIQTSKRKSVTVNSTKIRNKQFMQFQLFVILIKCVTG
jgi:hypothetical protein